MSVPVVLRINKVTKAFGKLTAVDSLELEVPEGAVFGFLGPNGAGKSTTIRLILSLVAPDCGDIEIFGQSVRKQRSASLRQVGAFVEDPDFYANLSARRNLQILSRLQGSVDHHRIDEVLAIVELSDRADDKVRGYSRGMRQRLGIAQALLNHPRLLILDEPTSGLDPAGIRAIRQLIIRLAVAEQMTVFLSSHILHEVEQMCSAVAVINHGHLIQTGSVRELLSQQVLTEFQVAPVAAARSLLENDAAVREAHAEQGVIRVNVDQDEIPRLIRLLVDNGITIRAIIPRSSLEDYFLALTGDTLR
ncbi:MAG: ABC transporter ATP-binding protein [Candidatus Neomarinimicrobiota bacterium]